MEHNTEFVPDPVLALEAGKSWQEHQGAECDFDVDTWIITSHEPGTRLEFQGKQTGILRRIRMSMEPAEGGWRLVEDIHFTPTAAGKFGPSVAAGIIRCLPKGNLTERRSPWPPSTVCWVTTVGGHKCGVTVMAVTKVMRRVQIGSADSIESFCAAIAPLVARGQSAVLR